MAEAVGNAAAMRPRRAITTLLRDWQIKGRFGSTVWIVRPPERAVLPAVRAFTDFLVERLGVKVEAA